MKIAVVGCGPVGLTLAVWLAISGREVSCYERDVQRRAAAASGEIPFKDPALAEALVKAIASGNLFFRDDLKSAAADADAVFVALPTASGAGGLSVLFDAVEELSAVISKECLIVIKSTVPAGACAALRRRFNIRVAVNPEFLRQGSGFSDFTSPARIVVGVDDDDGARKLLRKIYAPFIEKRTPYIETGANSAEIGKLAANMFLAARIAILNEVADLCEAAGGNIGQVREILMTDARIGREYLFPGAGFGGKCLPKDGRLLLESADARNISMPAVKAVYSSNRRRAENIAERILAALPASPTVAVWGLAFKPGSDDVQESAAMSVAEVLLRKGARVQACEPSLTGSGNLGAIKYFGDPLSALAGADGLAALVFSESYKQLSLPAIANTMKGKVIFDCAGVFRKRGAAPPGIDLRILGESKKKARR